MLNPYYYIVVPLVLLLLRKRKIKDSMEVLDINTLKLKVLPITQANATARDNKGKPIYFGSPYGKRGNDFHNGQDIPANTGTNIYTPLDGTVASVFFSALGGNSIIIYHGLKNEIRTGYAHLSKFNVKAGQKVKAGDVIGLVGNTGSHTTGSHLHFTLSFFNNGIYTPVNPKPYLKALLP